MNGVERLGWRDHLLGLVLAALYVAVLLATSTDLAMSRDESFYVVAAERYGGWLVQLWEDPGAATEQSAVDGAWSYNHEHPSLMKTAFALSWLAHDAWDVFPVDSMAFRFPGMLTAGLLLWLVWVFGARVFGRGAGLFAALTMALVPRFFYHAHLDCFDVPMALTSTLTIYCYWRSLTRPWWAVWTGVAFGLALATKHNSWIIPGILLIHWVWAIVGELRARRRREEPRVRLVPWWLVAMVAIGPALFVGSWPWMWNETWPRFQEYAAFHLKHVHYVMEYMGTSYHRPPFPVSYPFVMTWYTVPATTLLLALGALGVRARTLVPPRLAERFWSKGAARPDRRFTDVLLFGALLAPLAVIAWPTTPIFGGTKHWLTSYPFVAMYAGVGFMTVAARLRQWLGERVPRARLVLPGAAAALLLAPGVVETAHAHPFGLSYYGWAAGGIPGAADDGMNRQFWGFTTGSLAGWLEKEMPDGGSVWLCDTTWQAWRMMHRDGMIPDNIRAARNMARADYAIVHHEEHFREVDFQAWVAYGTVRPVHVLTYDGVPIISVYENPRRR